MSLREFDLVRLGGYPQDPSTPNSQNERLSNSRCWPISEVATNLIEVRSLSYDGLVVLNMSFVAPGPNETFGRLALFADANTLWFWAKR